MLVQVLLEGLGLGPLLVLVCAIGIRKGTVGMAISSAVLSGIMALILRCVLAKIAHIFPLL